MTNINIPVMNRHRWSPEVAFGDVRYLPGGKFGPRIQNRYQLVVMNEGEAHIDIDDDRIYVPEHHAVLLLPNHRETFQWTRAAPTRHTWCEIAPHAMPPNLQAQIGDHPVVHPVTNYLLKAIEFGLSIPFSPFVSSDELVRSAGIMTFHTWMFEVEHMQRPAGEPVAIRRAIAFAEEHLSEPLTLDMLAAAATMSPQHLTRLFRRHLLVTPMRYVWLLRVRRGVELLGTTGLSVGEIAAQVGFQSPFHFSRLVAQHYNAPPRRLRQRIWHEQDEAEV
jgi:AraC family transcriptional regulator